MNAVVQAWNACGTAGREVAEETQPPATELRRQTQALLRVMQRTRGAAGAARGAQPTFSPRDFWRAVRSACPAFDNTRQHDAGHFFLELRRALARLPGHAEPSMAWAACLAEPEMQLVTQMSCTHPACMQTKHNRPAKGQPPRAPEPLVMATLEAGAVYEVVLAAAGRNSWFGPEFVADHRCDACGRRGGVRVTTCRTLPRVLVVCLKRFGTVAGVDTRIGAPVHGLGDDIDLGAHLDAEAGGAGGSRYRTRAVVCHHGATLADGHYTCWVRAAAAPGGPANDSWVHYDDRAVGPPEPDLPPSVAEEAYLIFYERAPAAAAGAPAATPGVVDETEEVVGCDDDEVEIGKDVVMEHAEGGDDPMDTT